MRFVCLFRVCSGPPGVFEPVEFRKRRRVRACFVCVTMIVTIVTFAISFSHTIAANSGRSFNWRGNVERICATRCVRGLW